MPLSTDNQTTRCEEILGILLFVGDWGKFPCPQFRLVEIMLMRFTKHRRNRTERELLAFL
jgi:hypothetical protein